MYAKTKQVSCTLSEDVVQEIDKTVGKTGTPRSEFIKIAVLKHASDLGIIRLDLDNHGGVYSLGLSRAAA